MRRIFLIGYMGAGKSTIGRCLGKALNLTFYDLDYFIESRYKKSISQIFEEEGEERFRKIESLILKEVGEFEDVIIATGGGTPCFFDNMEYMNSKGETVYLSASVRILTDRLIVAKSKRPLIADKTDQELYNYVSDSIGKRNIYYSQAKIIFDTDQVTNKNAIDECVENLIKVLD